MHALQRVDGSRKWDYFLPFESKVEWNERFYVGSSFQRQRLMALSCVVVSDYVIFPSGSKVVCLNRGDGTLKWQIDHLSSYDYISTPVLYRYKASSDGVDAVLVSSRDGTLHCFDIRTGTSLWKYGTGVNSLSAPALAPVVDSYSNIFILEKDKLTALDRDGARLWYEESCAGEGIYSSAAISREGMIAVACNDSSVRLYCCRKCEVSEPVPYAGSVFQGNNTGVLVSNKLAVNITLRHRMVWKNLRVMPMCRMGSSSWPAQRITSSLLQCEIPTLEAILDDHNSFSIALKQHTITYKRCFANTSTGMIQLPCSYVDESEAFLPACRDRYSSTNSDLLYWY
jgi:WD40 repeat protein